MALFNDQQQQEPETQLQPYGVSSGTRVRARVVQHVPYVLANMNTRIAFISVGVDEIGLN